MSGKVVDTMALPPLPQFSGPKDKNTAQAVPATADEAATPFVCTTIRAALTGKSCVHQIVRVMASAKRRSGNVEFDPAFTMMHPCYGCPAGLSRVRLIGLEKIDEIELLSKRSAAERASTSGMVSPKAFNRQRSVETRLTALKSDPMTKKKKSPKTWIAMKFVYEYLLGQKRESGEAGWFNRPELVKFSMINAGVSDTSVITAIKTMCKQGVMEVSSGPLVEARGGSLDDRPFDKKTGKFAKPKTVQTFRLSANAETLAPKVVYFESGSLLPTDMVRVPALASTVLAEAPILPNRNEERNEVGESLGGSEG